jgi:hypothetical protein
MLMTLVVPLSAAFRRFRYARCLHAALQCLVSRRVALCGPEPDTVSEYEADDFVAMLEAAEMVRPDDL